MSGELGRRVATALVLAPLVVIADFALPTAGFAVLIGIFVLLGAWEWPPLVGATDDGARLRFTLATGLAMILLWPLLESRAIVLTLLAGGLGWSAVCLAMVVRYQQGIDEPTAAGPFWKVLSGWLTLLPAWVSLVFLHGGFEVGPGATSGLAADRAFAGPGAVLLLLLLIWAADVGAYFAGRRFGRARLASRVSPGKSAEGLAGGLIAVVVLGVAARAAAAAFGYEQWPGSLTMFLALFVFTALVSVLGDLSESMLKRKAGVKDSGTVVPGHGGMLDRLDSISSAGPVFALGLLLLAALPV